MKYKDFMNEFGERVDQMSAGDEAICAIAIVVIAALLSGLFVGAV